MTPQDSKQAAQEWLKEALRLKCVLLSAWAAGGSDDDDGVACALAEDAFDAHLRKAPGVAPESSPAVPVVPAGYALMPVEPTEELLNAGWDGGWSAVSNYRALLAAAPVVAPAVPQGVREALDAARRIIDKGWSAGIATVADRAAIDAAIHALLHAQLVAPISDAPEGYFTMQEVEEFAAAKVKLALSAAPAEGVRLAECRYPRCGCNVSLYTWKGCRAIPATGSAE